MIEYLRNSALNRSATGAAKRIVIPGSNSYWILIRGGVPQGSILGPSHFLLYINDIVLEIRSNIRLFADDASLFIVVETPLEASNILNNDLAKITRRNGTWLVSFNTAKTNSLLMSQKNKHYHPFLNMQDQ